MDVWLKATVSWGKELPRARRPGRRWWWSCCVCGGACGTSCFHGLSIRFFGARARLERLMDEFVQDRDVFRCLACLPRCCQCLGHPRAQLSLSNCYPGLAQIGPHRPQCVSSRIQRAVTFRLLQRGGARKARPGRLDMHPSYPSSYHARIRIATFC